MNEVSGIQAVAWGLQDGGITLATVYPGFHAHELADRMGVDVCSINEKNAFAVAWGVSLAGSRSATMFKNVGLNDAADPYINACILGVRGGMVLVVLDDIDVEQSQIKQDSRPYADFPCSLWLEPRSVKDAYELARLAPQLSESLGTLVVLRLTNLLTRAVGPVTRLEPLTAQGQWCRDPERWVVHPVYGETQRKRLLERQEAIAQWVDRAYPEPRIDPSSVVRVSAGMAATGGEDSPHLSVYTFPLPRPWLHALAMLASSIVVEEHGGPYLASKIAAAIGASRIIAKSISPDVDRRYRITDRYEPLYALLRSIAGHVIVGDLGGHTLDPHHTVDACLCFGCSVGVATGVSLADPTLQVFCVTGDAAFLHSGKAALEEAITRRAAVTVIVLDNGGSQGTGGQLLPGSCRLNTSSLEYYDLDFPQACEGGVLSGLLERPQGPRLIRLRTPF